MQTTYLQRLLALNTKEITLIEKNIKFFLNEARYFRDNGKKDSMAMGYAEANKHRAKLRSAVETQMALKAELRHNSDIESLKQSNNYLMIHDIGMAVAGSLTVRERANIFRTYVKAHKSAPRLTAFLAKDAFKAA